MKIKGTENSSYILSNIGKNIRNIRVSKSLSQKDLSKISGISFSTVARLEKGENISMESFIKVLKALDCADNLSLLLPEIEVNVDTASDNKKQKHGQNCWVWGDEK